MEEQVNDQIVTMNIPVDDPAGTPENNPQPTTEPTPEPSSIDNPQTPAMPLIGMLPQPEPEKRPAHRPCTYCERKEELQTITNDYYAKFENGEKEGIPFIEELVVKLKIHRETLLNWMNKLQDDGTPEHPQLFDTVKRIENMQRLKLLKRTLSRYNPTGAIFQLKANHGFVEAEKRIITGDRSEPLQIEIIEDRHA